SAGPVETDLRLVIGEKEASLESRRPGQEQFQPVKNNQLNQLLTEIRQGLTQLTSEAELLWNLFLQNFDNGFHQLQYYDDEACGIWRRILRMRQLEDRVVTRQGQLLARSAEPLRWEMVPAESDKSDYTLRLVQANGESAPPIVCIMEGHPAFYLSSTTLFI